MSFCTMHEPRLGPRYLTMMGREMKCLSAILMGMITITRDDVDPPDLDPYGAGQPHGVSAQNA